MSVSRANESKIYLRKRKDAKDCENFRENRTVVVFSMSWVIRYVECIFAK